MEPSDSQRRTGMRIKKQPGPAGSAGEVCIVSGSARMSRLSCYMMRMLPLIALALAAVAHGQDRAEGRGQESFELVETTIPDIQHAYRSELLTPEQLVKMYQARIAA